ncbi:MAG TPA: 50S ribosomal protein L11 methyltransferase [Chitinophagaceae bacterium]|nr:50S ribosomal protein L11 methyltransferase [Chitinophagaceae bacterium]
MEKFIKIDIETNSSERLEILIAELSDINFYAFEQNNNVLIAYIKEENFDQPQFHEALCGEVYKSAIIENRNWNQEWERGVEPVYIKKFAGIRASFHQPLRSVKHEIIITPKMSFGTGHHATTYLMIEQMEEINFRNKKVLDFGTGTGILAILAEKLGAKEVLAIDNDEWSINNALENLKANNCKQIFLGKKDDVTEIVPQDIILANINLNVLIQNASNISSISHKGTLLIMSGFLFEDETKILSSFNTIGFVKKTMVNRNDWMSLSMNKK